MWPIDAWGPSIEPAKNRPHHRGSGLGAGGVDMLDGTVEEPSEYTWRPGG